MELKKLKESCKRRKIVTINKEDYEDITIRNNTNCYAYALDSIYPCRDCYRWIGAISGKKRKDKESNEELIENLFLDCKKIGLKIKKSSYEEVIPKNSYKIALLSNEAENRYTTDFHFIRQDPITLKWSEKRWRELPRILGEYDKEEFNPERQRWHPFYIIGYFIIQKNGIKKDIEEGTRGEKIKKMQKEGM